MKELLETAWTFIFFIIVLPLIVSFIFKRFSRNKNDELERVLVCIVITMILAILLAALDQTNRVLKYTGEKEIVGMQYDNVMLISRYDADSKMYYNYMIKENDTYHQYQAESEYSQIKYTNGTPEVKYYEYESKFRVLHWIFPNGWINQDRYVFCIPKGSIKENFNINMSNN